MLYSHLAACTLAILTAPAVALPTSNAASLDIRVTTETWRIPSMDVHMMTRHSGLPGGGHWSEIFKFSSTIDFDITMPNDRNLHCRASFANGTLPDNLATCTGEGHRVGFRMNEYTALGPRRKELAFVLQVFRIERRGWVANDIVLW